MKAPDVKVGGIGKGGIAVEIKPIASGSDGNAYMISDGTTDLLIECGIPFKELLDKTNFFVPLPNACLISHSHKDHSESVEQIRSIGIPVYMSEDTHNEVKDRLQGDFGIKTIRNRERFKIHTFEILPLKMNHDVYCLGFLITSQATNEKLFFATDTYYIEYIIPSCDYIMIEANYDVDIMNERIMKGGHDLVSKERLVRSHMEIGSTIRWLEGNDLSKTKRIYLMHLSAGSSNEEQFKRRIIEATGIPCTIC